MYEGTQISKASRSLAREFTFRANTGHKERIFASCVALVERVLQKSCATFARQSDSPKVKLNLLWTYQEKVGLQQSTKPADEAVLVGLLFQLCVREVNQELTQRIFQRDLNIMERSYPTAKCILSSCN